MARVFAHGNRANASSLPQIIADTLIVLYPVLDCAFCFYYYSN